MMRESAQQRPSAGRGKKSHTEDLVGADRTGGSKHRILFRLENRHCIFGSNDIFDESAPHNIMSVRDRHPYAETIRPNRT